MDIDNIIRDHVSNLETIKNLILFGGLIVVAFFGFKQLPLHDQQKFESLY